MLNITKLVQRALPDFFRQKAYFGFSEYFANRDKSEILLYYDRKITDQRYSKLKYKWQDDLLKKKERRARKLEMDSQKSVHENQESKFVVHNPREEVEIPCNPDQVFAIVEIAGYQYKVTKDDLVVSEWIKDLDINQTIELSRVFLVGTKDYTSIGRPLVESAKVIATVEQQALSEKEIVFKKNRRKRFRQSQGHRQNITILRINQIEHSVTQSELNRAVSLI